jgi:hypothetical protein
LGFSSVAVESIVLSGEWNGLVSLLTVVELDRFGLISAPAMMLGDVLLQVLRV